MNFKKFLSLTVSLFFIVVPIISFADDSSYDIDVFSNLELEASYNLNDKPTINARHSVVIDRSSNTILFGKNKNEKCKMASTTKIMTAVVVLENCSNLNDVVTVSKKAARNRWLKTWVVTR